MIKENPSESQSKKESRHEEPAEEEKTGSELDEFEEEIIRNTSPMKDYMESGEMKDKDSLRPPTNT